MDTVSYIIGAVISGSVAILTTYINHNAENKRIELKNKHQIETEKAKKNWDYLEYSHFKIYAPMYFNLCLIEYYVKEILKILNENNQPLNENLLLRINSYQINIKDINDEIIKNIKENFGYLNLNDDDQMLIYIFISEKTKIYDLIALNVSDNSEEFNDYYQSFSSIITKLRWRILISYYYIKNKIGVESFDDITEKLMSGLSDKEKEEFNKIKSDVLAKYSV